MESLAGLDRFSSEVAVNRIPIFKDVKVPIYGSNHIRDNVTGLNHR
jgi:hypothetical protein